MLDFNKDQFLRLTPYWGMIFVWFFFLLRKDKELSKNILWSSFRVFVQLILLAFALESIFKSQLVVMTLFVSLIMTLNSSLQISSKAKKEKTHLIFVTFFSQVICLWPLGILFSLEENPDDFFTSKALLPLLGMLLGNSLNGITIAREYFSETMEEKKEEVISLLGVGASLKEATDHIFFKALRKGITPQLNSMLAMGVVSIPGMMAGQLISDTIPLKASLTQIKMMFSILAGTLSCIFVMMIFIRQKYFTSKGELCLR